VKDLKGKHSSIWSREMQEWEVDVGVFIVCVILPLVDEQQPNVLVLVEIVEGSALSDVFVNYNSGLLW
jgi:hypothetical protein